MSKLNFSLVKAKIESIAKNPSNKNKSKENKLNISSKTLKDSFSYLQEFKEALNNQELNIKKVETNYLENNKLKNNNNNNNNNNNTSSLRTKESSCNINGINESHKEIIKEIKIEEMSELKEIYNDLFLLFNDIKLNDTLFDKNKNLDNFNKLKIMAVHTIKILFNENFKKITKLFCDAMEVNKFFLYQIYLILSIIYMNLEKLNEYSLLSYKTIILYSLQNFDIIYKLLENITFIEDAKINKNIFILNKIIISLLNTITNVPSNSKIMFYISPNKNKCTEENKEENESRINNLLILLKNNKELIKKIDEIEKEESKILKRIEASNQKILPEFDSKKFKLTVFIELDETLVHYCEEGDNYFVKVRLGSENFLEYIKSFCEVIIITTSSKEYSDIIIDNLNKNGNVIQHRIYVEDYNFLDLSKINRDMNKCIFISHELNFMKEPEDNSIILKGFYGDETDKEFIKLEKEFKKLEKKEIDDIRNNIKEILKNINKEKQ